MKLLKYPHLILLLLLMSTELLQAQDIATRMRTETSRAIKKDNDTSTWNLKQGGQYNFNLSQSSLSNWAAGGDNFNLALNSYFNYYTFFKKGMQSWDNNLDTYLGFIQSTSLGGRKNDDRIDILSKYGYRIDTTGMWYLSGLFNFRSQLFDGYSYSGTNANFTSSFLSPAYIILSAGLDFKPNNIFSVFFSPLTSRTTLLLNTKLSNAGSYGVPAGKKINRETGLFVTLNYNNTIAPNITYKARADFFSDYYEKPENINIYMMNMMINLNIM